MIGLEEIITIKITEATGEFLKKIRNLVDTDGVGTHVELMPSMLRYQNLEIHFDTYKVYVKGKERHITASEFAALKLLTLSPKRVFTKQQIYQAIYGSEEAEEIENSIYCLIRGIRKKLETDPHHPQYIHTVRGVGYRFEPPEA